jgi:DNA polymerase III delta prime subunit
MEHMLWVEKYRPSKVEDCILPEDIKTTFQGYVDRKEIPNLLLSGNAGVGKTTIAKALCQEVGCDYIVINSSETNGIGDIRTTVRNYATSMSFSGGRKVIIMDEADNMSPEAQKALRGMMEEVSINCTFIFTCNFKNRIMDAIHSRCTVIDFKLNGNKAKMATQFFKRIAWILDQERISYDKEVVAAVITKHFPDNRRILNELQRYSVSGSIDKGILSSVSEIQIQDLIKFVKGKDLGGARKWVTNNSDRDISEIFRQLYDVLWEKLSPSSVPALITTIGEWQYRSAFCPDQEITLMACLTEIMMECSFKD